MIPKKIHYCWFGKNPKNSVVSQCIKSWKKYASDFEIQEWNEKNFPIFKHYFTTKMYKKKYWAFVSDYARLFVLEKIGGVYLDTDMLLVQSLTPLLKNNCFLGEEESKIISAGIIGSKAHHPFIIACKEYYDTHTEELITIPHVLTKTLSQYNNKNSITIYPPKTFYPFGPTEIKNYKGQILSSETYGVHLWNYSWGHPLNKFFKKIGIHTFGKQFSENLKIKKFLKKIFKFI